MAAQQMRRILIDHARAHRAEKRGGGEVRLSLDEVNGPTAPREEQLLEIDRALDELGKLDQRCARVVELRFFAGLTEKEAAEVLGISTATLKRDWDFARARLISQLGSNKTG